MSEQSQKEEEAAKVKEVEETMTPGKLPLSKRAAKRELKRRQWLESKPERRSKQKAERKRKREELRAAGVAAAELPGASGVRKRLKEATMEASSCKVGVVIDFSFDDYMHQRDLGKCCKQLLHCYSLNRRLPNPMQFHVTGLRGRGREEMDKHEGFANWDVHFHEKDYHEVLPKSDLVYLTSESDNVVTSLDPGTNYVIGGLVDHNRHKGLCHRLAVEKGVRHARLPLEENVAMRTRRVLTIDHVFEILGLVSQGGDWKESILKVLPARKGVTDKPPAAATSNGEDEDSTRDQDHGCHLEASSGEGENSTRNREVPT